MTKNVSNPFHYIKRTCEARADLHAWKSFIENFNGKSVFLGDTWISSDCLKSFTDAAESAGFAAVFGSWWFAESWRESLIGHQIAVKELFPIVLAVEIWGKHMQNSKILFLSDNMAVVDTK